MLVLNRKCDQEILIDGNICVKVLSVKGNTVRIGIEAPGEVPILRRELTDIERDDFRPVAASGNPGRELQTAVKVR